MSRMARGILESCHVYLVVARVGRLAAVYSGSLLCGVGGDGLEGVACQRALSRFSPSMIIPDDLVIAEALGTCGVT